MAKIHFVQKQVLLYISLVKIRDCERPEVVLLV